MQLGAELVHGAVSSLGQLGDWGAMPHPVALDADDAVAPPMLIYCPVR